MSPTSVGAADEKRIKETEGSESLAALAVHRRKRGSRGRLAVFSGRESPRSVSELVGPDGLAERLGAISVSPPSAALRPPESLVSQATSFRPALPWSWQKR